MAGYNYFERCYKLAQKMMNNGIAETLKEEFSNAHGAVTLSRLAFEAIGALILVIILILVPRLGSTIESGMPAIPEGSEWAGASGADYLCHLCLLFADLCDNRFFQGQKTVCRTADTNKK